MVDIEKSRIFVSIAAYRDAETRNTINDLFAKATNKSRVFVGVLSQIDHRTDIEFLIGVRRNVREMVVDSREAKGCTWARSTILTQLRKDEEFVLQVDAHSRFDQGWDNHILEEFKSIGKDNVVLTAYPPAFQIDNPLNTTPKHVHMKFRDIHISGLPFFLADVSHPQPLPDKPRPTPAVSAGCLFGPKEVFDKVPYDPYVYFFGEEQSYAIRLYTSGVDIYVPTRTFMYHLYYDPSKDKKNLHWNDIKLNNLPDITCTGVARVMYILGMSGEFPHDNAKDINLYGLGTVRTVEQWQEFSGFNLKTGQINDKGTKGNYHEYP